MPAFHRIGNDPDGPRAHGHSGLDQALQRAASRLQETIKCSDILVESADVLISTKLYFNDVNADSSRIREAVFLENNRLTLSESLSLMSQVNE